MANPRETPCLPWRLAVAAIAVSAGCSRAPAKSSSAAVDPRDARVRGEVIAAKMLAAYRNARSYADHASYVQQAAFRGEGVERELPFFQMSLALVRPNKLRLSFEETIAGQTGRKGYDIASDGKRMRATATP